MTPKVGDVYCAKHARSIEYAQVRHITPFSVQLEHTHTKRRWDLGLEYFTSEQCGWKPARHKGFRHGDPRATAAGKIGGKVSAEARQAKRAAYWEAQGVDPVKAEIIYQSGYQAGWVKGRRGK